jgi:mannose-6-phosphate isomerase-like protein (cupin superfamily)
MTDIRTSAADYTAEPVKYGPLQLIDLDREAAEVTEIFRNQVLLEVNNHCLRLGVLAGQYPWHKHPHSDELFLVLDGSIVVELDDGRTFELGPHQSISVPAGAIHRTRGEGRTVNLCFESMAAETVFLEPRDLP